MYEKENKGQNPYRVKPFNQKEGATKETKLCLPLLPPDQAFSDNVSLIVMYNVETILVTCMLNPLTDYSQHSLSLFPTLLQKEERKEKKRWLQVSLMVTSLMSRTQHTLIIPKLKHDFSHFDLVQMLTGWSIKADTVKCVSDIPSEYV